MVEALVQKAGQSGNGRTGLDSPHVTEIKTVFQEGKGGGAMTQEQLAALAIYRNHKYCKCPECEMARIVLREMDWKNARSTNS